MASPSRSRETVNSNLKNHKVPFTRRVAYQLAKDNPDVIRFNRRVDTPDCSGAIGPRTSLSEIHLEPEGPVAGEFTTVDLLATLFAIGLFFYDVVSDIILAYHYFDHRRWWHFALTTVFIAAPAVIANIHSLVWYKKDYSQEKKRHDEDPSIITTPSIVWYLRIIFTFPFMIGPVVRHIEYVYHGMKSKSTKLPKEQRDYHFEQMLLEDTDAGLMRMLEGFLEAAPQLILQIYILVTERPEEAVHMRYIRPIAMLGSWLGMTWSLVSYYKALRAIHEVNEGTAVTIHDFPSFCKYFIKTAGYFLWRASEVGPRVVIIALFASQFTHFVFVALGLHWLFMFIWLLCQKTQFYKDTASKRHAEIVFNIIVGYICIYCFLNPRDGHTRYRALIYYILFYIENILMMLAWVYFTDHKSDWFYFATIAAVSLGLILQIFFQISFYVCCHTRKKDIKFCLWPVQNHNFYISVCHDLDDKPETIPV